MLFAATVHILVQKSRGMTRWSFLVAEVAMFSVATASVCTSIYVLFGLLINEIAPSVPFSQTQHVLFLVNT
jgi:hypothetical protein